MTTTKTLTRAQLDVLDATDRRWRAGVVLAFVAAVGLLTACTTSSNTGGSGTTSPAPHSAGSVTSPTHPPTGNTASNAWQPLASHAFALLRRIPGIEIPPGYASSIVNSDVPGYNATGFISVGGNQVQRVDVYTYPDHATMLQDLAATPSPGPDPDPTVTLVLSDGTGNWYAKVSDMNFPGEHLGSTPQAIAQMLGGHVS